jgi:hypothetical protein
MKTFAIFCFSISLLPCAKAQSQAPNLKGKIIVDVFDATSRRPLIKAAVKIVELRCGVFTKPGTQGRATVSNIEPGIYSIEVSFPGYRDHLIKDVRVGTHITPYMNVWLEEYEYDRISCFGPARSNSSNKINLPIASDTVNHYSLQQNISKYAIAEIGLVSAIPEKEGFHTLRYLYEEEEQFVIERNELSIYPNPATTASHLCFSTQKEDKFMIKIYDYSGNMLYQDRFEPTTSGRQIVPLNVSSLSIGMYFVHVIGTDKYFRKSFSIVR